MEPSGRLPSLFIAKVDVTQAFDTIEQELLLNIVRDLAQEVLESRRIPLFDLAA